MTSQVPFDGVIEAASRLDSSVIGARFSESVLSACISVALLLRTIDVLLATVRAIASVFGLAADELLDDLIALVAKLPMNPDFRRVVPLDCRALGHDEKRFEGSLRIRLVLVGADG